MTTGQKIDIVASGNSLIGTNAMVYVERASPETVHLNSQISGLTLGTRYVARVSAWNGYKWSQSVVSALSAAPKVVVPTAPLNVYFVIWSDTEITVWWIPPVTDGGSPVSGYSVQWDASLTFGNADNGVFATPDKNSFKCVSVSHLRICFCFFYYCCSYFV